MTLHGCACRKSGWPGLDLTFGADFWALLPVFVLVNLTAFMKAVGDLSVIHRASYRNQAAVDFRTVQGGLNVYGAGTLVSGLLGTLPVAAPWAATAVYIGFTGVAARSVGVYLGTVDHDGRLVFQAACHVDRHSQPSGRRGVHHHLRHALHRGRENGICGPG